MAGESGVNRRIIHELRSWDIHVDQMVGESGVTRSVIDQLPPLDLQRYQM